jgi:hypothetical protein
MVAGLLSSFVHQCLPFRSFEDNCCKIYASKNIIDEQIDFFA